MRRVVCLWVAVSFFFCSGVAFALRSRSRTVPGEVVVRTSRPLDLGKAKSKTSKDHPFFEAVDLRPEKVSAGKKKDVRVPRNSYLYLLKGDKNLPTQELLEAARKLPGVSPAEPNYIGTLSFVPSDPQYSQTADHFACVGMEAAWDVQQGA